MSFKKRSGESAFLTISFISFIVDYVFCKSGAHITVYEIYDPKNIYLDFIIVYKTPIKNIKIRINYLGQANDN